MVRPFPLAFLLTGLTALLVTFLVNWERGAFSDQGKPPVIHHSSSSVTPESSDFPTPGPSRSSDELLRLKANLVLLTPDVQKARDSHGLIPAGVYSPSGVCNKIQKTDFGAEVALKARYLMWEEAGVLHFVPAIAPDKPTIYDIQSDVINISTPGADLIPMRAMTYNGKQVLVGYKGDSIFSKEDGSWIRLFQCDSDSLSFIIILFTDLLSASEN